MHRQDDDAMADISINNRLVKLPSLIDQTCFEFIDVSYFGAVFFCKTLQMLYSAK